jgi:hypothetical protein
MAEDKKNKPDAEGRHQYIPGIQEKSTIGGAFNSGVTSHDPDEKNEIEKKASLANLKPRENREDQGPDQTI